MKQIIFKQKNKNCKTSGQASRPVPLIKKEAVSVLRQPLQAWRAVARINKSFSFE